MGCRCSWCWRYCHTGRRALSHHWVISVLQLAQRGTKKSLGLSRKGQQRNPEEGSDYTCEHSKGGRKANMAISHFASCFLITVWYWDNPNAEKRSYYLPKTSVLANIHAYIHIYTHIYVCNFLEAEPVLTLPSCSWWSCEELSNFDALQTKMNFGLTVLKNNNKSTIHRKWQK